MNYYYAHLQCISILIIFVLYLCYIHILHRWHGGHFKRWLKSHKIDINTTLNNKYVAILSYTNVIPLLRQFRNVLYTYHINIPFPWSLSLLSIDASSTELTQAYNNTYNTTNDTIGNTSETINRYPYAETINRLVIINYYYEGNLLPAEDMSVVIREIPENLPIYNAPVFTPTPVPIRPTTHISSGPYTTTPYTTHTYNPITTTSTANNTANSSANNSGNNSSNNSIVGLAPVVPSTSFATFSEEMRVYSQQTRAAASLPTTTTATTATTVAATSTTGPAAGMAPVSAVNLSRKVVSNTPVVTNDTTSSTTVPAQSGNLQGSELHQQQRIQDSNNTYANSTSNSNTNSTNNSNHSSNTNSPRAASTSNPTSSKKYPIINNGHMPDLSLWTGSHSIPSTEQYFNTMHNMHLPSHYPSTADVASSNMQQRDSSGLQQQSQGDAYSVSQAYVQAQRQQQAVHVQQVLLQQQLAHQQHQALLHAQLHPQPQPQRYHYYPPPLTQQPLTQAPTLLRQPSFDISTHDYNSYNTYNNTHNNAYNNNADTNTNNHNTTPYTNIPADLTFHPATAGKHLNSTSVVSTNSKSSKNQQPSTRPTSLMPAHLRPPTIECTRPLASTTTTANPTTTTNNNTTTNNDNTNSTSSDNNYSERPASALQIFYETHSIEGSSATIGMGIKGNNHIRTGSNLVSNTHNYTYDSNSYNNDNGTYTTQNNHTNAGATDERNDTVSYTQHNNNYTNDTNNNTITNNYTNTTTTTTSNNNSSSNKNSSSNNNDDDERVADMLYLLRASPNAHTAVNTTNNSNYKSNNYSANNNNDHTANDSSNKKRVYNKRSHSSYNTHTDTHTHTTDPEYAASEPAYKKLAVPSRSHGTDNTTNGTAYDGTSTSVTTTAAAACGDVSGGNNYMDTNMYTGVVAGGGGGGGGGGGVAVVSRPPSDHSAITPDSHSNNHTPAYTTTPTHTTTSNDNNHTTNNNNSNTTSDTNSNTTSAPSTERSSEGEGDDEDNLPLFNSILAYY